MALITDKFGKASSDTNYALATTVKTARTEGESVLACFDLSRFSTTAPVFFVTYKKTTDPVTDEVSVTNQVSWKALVNPDNNTLTNLTLAPGYEDIGNDIGDFVECIPTSYWANELINGIRTSLNDDGTLKSTAVRAALEVTMNPADIIANFVADGGVIDVDSGLIGNFSDMVYYIDAVRYTKTAIADKIYTASKHTYVDIDEAGNVTYSETAINAAQPALPAGTLRRACVTTNATNITSIAHYSNGSNSDGWEELASADATQNENTIVINLPKEKRFMKVLVVFNGFTAGLTDYYLRINNISSAVYGGRVTALGSAYATSLINNGTSARLYTPGSTWPRAMLSDIDIRRPSAGSGMTIQADTSIVAGADIAGVTAARSVSDFSIFQNPVATIASLSLSTAGGMFVTGSRIIVLGRD